MSLFSLLIIYNEFLSLPPLFLSECHRYYKPSGGISQFQFLFSRFMSICGLQINTERFWNVFPNLHKHVRRYIIFFVFRSSILHLYDHVHNYLFKFVNTIKDSSDFVKKSCKRDESFTVCVCVRMCRCMYRVFCVYASSRMYLRCCPPTLTKSNVK